MVQINFDPKTAPEEKTRTLWPAGEYVVIISGTDQKSSKNGEGSYLEVVLQAMEGAMKGLTMYDNLNLVNANEQTVNIAQGRLRSYCEATDTPVLNDTQQLHNKPFRIKVAIENDDAKNTAKGKPCFGDQNRIKKVMALNAPGATPAATKPAATRNVGW